MGGETLMGLIDAKLVGGLGKAALGGVGLGVTLMYLGYSIVFGVMRGVKVRTAFAVGEGRPEEGLAYAKAGMFIGALIGVLMFALGRNVAPVFAWLGADAELHAPAAAFFEAVSWGAPPTTALVALVQWRQALGDSKSPMYVSLLANVVNAALAYALIYGHLGLPALGVRGAGFATALVEYMQFALLFTLYVRAARKSPAPALGPKRAAREVLTLGGPTGVQFGAEMLAFTTFTAILGSLASAQIASHQIALAIIRTSFLPGVAVGEATSVLVGRSLGQRRLDEADRVTSAALRLAVSFMAACGVVFAAAGGPLARVFTTDGEVVAITTRLLLVAAVFQVLDAVNIVLRGALRGAKDVRFAAVVGTSVVWACMPTAAWWFGKHLGHGAFGGWFGFVGETTIASSILLVRWRRGSWRKAYAVVPEVPPSVPIPAQPSLRAA